MGIGILDKIPYERIEGVPRWQRWLIVGVVIFLIILLYYSPIHPWSYSKKSGEIEALRTRLKELEDEYNKHQRYIEKRPELENEIGKLDTDLKLARVQLPDSKEIPELLTQISDLGLQAGLEFMLFKPLPENRIDFYSEVPVEINITGGFHNIATFFDNVRKLTRIVNITDVNIKVKSEEKTPILEMRCKATTFKYIEDITATK
ncbi:MAG: type 4a pilus biogenesis protein PilO [Nitrospinae bacterium]|nr:type 4a pilus biogenesis protein PilO [Nitrospinota bacterium]